MQTIKNKKVVKDENFWYRAVKYFLYGCLGIYKSLCFMVCFLPAKDTKDKVNPSVNSFYPRLIWIEGLVKCGKILSKLLLQSSKPPFRELLDSILDIQLQKRWEISTKEAVVRMFLPFKDPYFLQTQLFCVKKAIQAKEGSSGWMFALAF